MDKGNTRHLAELVASVIPLLTVIIYGLSAYYTQSYLGYFGLSSNLISLSVEASDLFNTTVRITAGAILIAAFMIILATILGGMLAKTSIKGELRIANIVLFLFPILGVIIYLSLCWKLGPFLLATGSVIIWGFGFLMYAATNFFHQALSIETVNNQQTSSVSNLNTVVSATKTFIIITTILTLPCLPLFARGLARFDAENHTLQEIVSGSEDASTHKLIIYRTRESFIVKEYDSKTKKFSDEYSFEPINSQILKDFIRR